MPQRGWIATWGRIARYCDKSVRTTKRYHYEYGMPVYRLGRNIPHVITVQVDLWLEAYSLIKHLRKRKIIKCRKFSCLRLFGKTLAYSNLYNEFGWSVLLADFTEQDPLGLLDNL